MEKQHFNRLLSFRGLLTMAFLCIVFINPHTTKAQVKEINNLSYTQYKPRYFKPKFGLNYTLYGAAILTVDPLGLGGKSAFALSAGSKITLWESKLENQMLQGLKIKGLYTAIGYEYFAQQYDNAYVSLWTRVKTFMMLVGRIDGLYSFGYGKQGVASRFCVGFEISRFTFLMSGTIYSANSQDLFGEHPNIISPYTNAGSIMLLIPVYNHVNR